MPTVMAAEIRTPKAHLVSGGTISAIEADIGGLAGHDRWRLDEPAPAAA
jgi:hypothetical protein